MNRFPSGARQVGRALGLFALALAATAPAQQAAIGIPPPALTQPSYSFDTAEQHGLKVQVVARGKKWPLELTLSCLAPRDMQHCGRCNKCAERRKAFAGAGLPDKTVYHEAA